MLKNSISQRECVLKKIVKGTMPQMLQDTPKRTEVFPQIEADGYFTEYPKRQIHEDTMKQTLKESMKLVKQILKNSVPQTWY